MKIVLLNNGLRGNKSHESHEKSQEKSIQIFSIFFSFFLHYICERYKHEDRINMPLSFVSRNFKV